MKIGPNTNKKKLNEKEAARHLGVSVRCVQNWRKEGKIPFYRISSRCIRYDLAEIERALRKFRFSAVGEGD